MVAEPAFPRTFDPEAFFSVRTLGGAAIYDPTGRLVKRCLIETEGRWDDLYNCLHFDERYIFDDREEDVMHWAVERAADGRLSAHEVSVVGTPKASMRGAVWRVTFRRRGQPPLAGATLTYNARFTQVTERMVLKAVTISWGIMPLAILRGYHQHLD